MFGSVAFCSTTTKPYAGGHQKVLNPDLMSLAAGHAHEATLAEENDCPAAATARAKLAARSDPGKHHRLHPDSSVTALSWTEGYAVEVHREPRVACDDTSPHERTGSLQQDTVCAAESITFLCTDPGVNTHFYVAGTVFKLPKTYGAVTRVYILWPKASYHGALPVTDDSGLDVLHGNAGSALVTRYVATNRPPPPRSASARTPAQAVWQRSLPPSHASLKCTPSELCGRGADLKYAQLPRDSGCVLASYLFLEELPLRTKLAYPKTEVWSQVGSSRDELWFRATYDASVRCSRALSLLPRCRCCLVVTAASLSLLPPCGVGSCSTPARLARPASYTCRSAPHVCPAVERSRLR